MIRARDLFVIFVFLVVSQVQAVALGPDGADLVRDGIKLMEKGDYEGALSKFTNAQIEMPDAPELHFNMGIALYKLERWDECEKALQNALFAPDRAIETRAAFHLANCAVKQGKFKEALLFYDRALKLDPNYLDAKVNREWTVRKVKELARKKKEEDDKKRAERPIVVKLQEIVDKLAKVHAGVRVAMQLKGEMPPKSPIVQYEDIFNLRIPEGTPSPFEKPEAEEEALTLAAGTQDEILTLTKALIEEIQQKLAPPESAPTSGMPEAPPDGEKKKLEDALPMMRDSVPFLEAAGEALAKDKSWSTANAPQEDALIKLLAAFRTLLDELNLMIIDQTQLLKQTHKASTETRPTTQPEGTLQPIEETPSDATLDRSQMNIGERLAEFTKAVEASIEALKKQQEESAQAQGSPNGQPPVPPGQDPATQIESYEKARTHLENAGGAMDAATARLSAREYKDAIEPETEALRELMKARDAMAPPNENGLKENGAESEEGQESQQDQQGQENDQKNQKENDKGKEGKNGDKGKQDGEDGAAKDDKKNEKLSEDQAKKMLERARQLERDRRKKQQDDARREGNTSGVTGGRDW